MAFRKKTPDKPEHQGIDAAEMDALASLLLKAFKQSIELEMDTNGSVNPRLLAEAVKWLTSSGVTLKPVDDLDGGAAGFDFKELYSSLDTMLGR